MPCCQLTLQQRQQPQPQVAGGQAAGPPPAAAPALKAAALKPAAAGAQTARQSSWAQLPLVLALPTAIGMVSARRDLRPFG